MIKCTYLFADQHLRVINYSSMSEWIIKCVKSFGEKLFCDGKEVRNDDESKTKRQQQRLLTMAGNLPVQLVFP